MEQTNASSQPHDMPEGAPDSQNVPDDRWDSDSALGSVRDDSSLTTSLTSEATDYPHENGRRYHAYREGTYHLPNDEVELDRLDLQHHLWRLTLDGALYLAPLPPSVSSVLDVGTGTGIWAIEFAEEHPEAAVLGTDLSPVQPAFVPPNCVFEVDDAEADWTFPNAFDFIHLRFLNLGIRQWPKFFHQAFKHLRPGGWLEVQEFVFAYPLASSSVRPNPATTSWSAAVVSAAAKIGIDLTAPARFGPLLEAAGFTDWKVEKRIWPVGPWSESPKEKKLGLWVRQDSEAALEAVSLAFLTRIEGWTREEIEVSVMGVRNEVRDPDVHQYAQLYIYYAQKPKGNG